MSTELLLPPVAPAPTVSIVNILEAVTAGGITHENMAVVERMMALHERMEAKEAEKAFNAALAAFQDDMPEIVAQSNIPNRGKYERYEDILHVARPLLNKHGFSVGFTQSADGLRIAVTCTLRHRTGHAADTTFAVRLGGKADSDTQADCKASTTAKRNALCLALNIIIRQDALSDEEDDARLAGESIDAATADLLRTRVKSLRFDEADFLDWMGVDSFFHVPASRLGEAHRFLDETEAASKKKGGK